jgi:hypothetical protein
MLSVRPEVVGERRVVLHQIEDEFEPLELLTPGHVTFGVEASKDGEIRFVRCGSEAETWALLKRVSTETEDFR